MVNASLNWASIVGIVLAVCGGGLYFLRSFKPALARDYDVFFAAIGLLCGGILFFQGWRLDPILQFGQFLLAGTTVFFAYESVRLRGIATDQARRSSFFEDDQIPNNPRSNSRSRWDDGYDQFDQPERISRRFKSRDLDLDDEDLLEEEYPSRRASRVIPESAVSRRRKPVRSDNYRGGDSINRKQFEVEKEPESKRNNFGERRSIRNEVKRGSRPLANQNTSRKSETKPINSSSFRSGTLERDRSNVRKQTTTNQVEDASFTQKNSDFKRTRQVRRSTTIPKSNANNKGGRYNVGSKREKPRDNSSRFDD